MPPEWKFRSKVVPSFSCKWDPLRGLLYSGFSSLAGIDEEIRVTTYKGNVRTDIVDSIKASSMAKFDGLI